MYAFIDNKSRVASLPKYQENFISNIEIRKIFFKIRDMTGAVIKGEKEYNINDWKIFSPAERRQILIMLQHSSSKELTRKEKRDNAIIRRKVKEVMENIKDKKRRNLSVSKKKIIRTKQDKQDTKQFNKIQKYRNKMIKSTVNLVENRNKFLRNIKKINNYIKKREKSGNPLSRIELEELEKKMKKHYKLINDKISRNSKHIKKVVVGGIKSGVITIKKQLSAKEIFLEKYERKNRKILRKLYILKRQEQIETNLDRKLIIHRLYHDLRDKTLKNMRIDKEIFLKNFKNINKTKFGKILEKVQKKRKIQIKRNLKELKITKPNTYRRLQKLKIIKR